jgi:imidazolonepropionase-like amidohydrolase
MPRLTLPALTDGTMTQPFIRPHRRLTRPLPDTAPALASAAGTACGPGTAPRRRPGRAGLAALLLTLASAGWPGLAPAQPNAPVLTDRLEGLRDNTPQWHAITGARLVLAPGQPAIDNGVLVLRDGRISAVGPAGTVVLPAGARRWHLPGRTVYAGFIDLASSLGLPPALQARPPALPGWGTGADLPAATPRPEPPRPPAGRALAAHNTMLRAEQDVAQQLEPKADALRSARALGFASALVAPALGVVRGQSALVQLRDEAANPKALVLAPRVAQHLAFETDEGAQPGYPSALMGAVALLRQTLLDAAWQAVTAAAAGAPPRRAANSTLDALAPLLAPDTAKRQLAIAQTDDEQDYQRFARLRDEFGLRLLLQGNGHEYRRAAQLKAAGLPVIVPLNYPPLPELDHPDSAIDTELETLQHWADAPANAGVLARAGVVFAISPAGLKDPAKTFWPRLREAVKRGLGADQALAALTSTPAMLIGQQDQLGTLARGRLANLVVASGDLFIDDDAVVEHVFVGGQPYATDAAQHADLRGRWQVAGSATPWVIGGSLAKPTLKLDGADCALRVDGRQLLLSLPCGSDADAERPTSAAPSAGQATTVPPAAERQTLVAELLTPMPPAGAMPAATDAAPELRGSLQTANGLLLPWQARRSAPHTAPGPQAADGQAPKPRPPLTFGASYPAGAYGITPPAQPAVLLVRGATVWTGAAAGVLADADLLVRQGRIAAVGRQLAAPADALVIDGRGKHVTAGLIDAHSHTAIARGVNEWTSSVTAEVRVGDALDATDIGLYRELAGGLTTANLLHGSANTIGGQSQTIKLRWGADAQALKFDGARPGIKFALGENVKQSNWGPGNNRYPQTRMGVEQVLRDAFASARQYRADWQRWRAAAQGLPPRRDLQLEALVELLERRRVVHVHAYRADEILMFVRLAQEFGLEVAAFQHVLEGYKVADAIAGIAAGASTFSDWWGYKMEVMDAIPANAAMLQRAGVLTSLNSDSDELARRLNTEAAKAVRHGGLSETEALALVTLNPARQLGVAERVGSLEVGKDADFVLWSAHPLSTAARAEQTWIDGRRYFDRDADAALRADAVRQRAALAARVRSAAADSKPPVPPTVAPPATAPATAADVMQYLQLQHQIRHAGHFAGSYWGGAAWHECTEGRP